jgi:3-oxoacyl-[acyl-carrier protein] reductase
MEEISKLFSLKDKVAVVTGGAINIGRAITLKLAAAGAQLAIIYNSSTSQAEDISKKLTQTGCKHFLFKADLMDEDMVVKTIGKVVEHFGRIDVLVNNSGIFGLSMQHVLEVGNWDEIFNLNLKGLFLCSREVLKQMMKQAGGGAIINIASINGMHPGFGMTAHYDASKGGVIAYTRSLAAEVAQFGIRVNAVAPGLVDSENLRKFAPELAEMAEKRTPLKKLATPEDVANTVLFLSSMVSLHITGEIITVDGGYLLT